MAQGEAAAATLPSLYWLAPIGAVTALIMAFFFYTGFMKQDEGDENMVRIAQAVRDGAYAYLRRQAKVVYAVVALLVIILVGMGLVGLQSELTWAGVAIASLFSGLCGYLGMKTATNASARTANAAKNSLNDGLKVAFRAGAVMGLCVTGFALLDISIWFLVLTNLFGMETATLTEITTITLSFAMGASLQALFARVGGGIYTKAADVGADLVGKVEAGIPEDDARNPATIADNVGDNVGDVAGMGADLYESYYGSILAAMALAAAAAYSLSLDASSAIKLVIAPAVLAGLGILTSIFSIFMVRAKDNASFSQLLKSLHGGVWLSSGLIIVGAFFLLKTLIGGEAFSDVGISSLGIFGSIVSGLIAGLVIAWGTEYYTSYEHAPTQRISKQAETGAATVIIAGIAEGMISTWIPLLTVVVAIMCAFIFAGGNEHFLLGVFGIGIAAVGMLSTLGITLATDAYGPIADNAGGNAEMTHQPPHVRERTDMLDSLGNTTAATGKGFAIGSAALTAMALLAAYVTTVQTNLDNQIVEGVATQQEIVAYAGNGGTFTIKDGTNEAGEDTFVGGILVSGNNKEIVNAIEAADGKIELTDMSGNIAGKSFEVVKVREASLPELLNFYNVTLMNPRVLCGLFIGVMMVMVFCAMTMNAVGRAAYAMMRECRRQFGIMKAQFKKDGMSDDDIADPMKWPFEVKADGHQYPDYASCVNISTGGALKEMVIPSLMAVLVPIIVGLVLGVPGTMGLLAGTLVCGFGIAIFMANAGGAWDNAKKYIETGECGGKGSDNHKATVVGDTVGDPFKDTSGPSLNILIKLVSIVSVVFAGLVVKFSPVIAAWLHLG
ncbi:sodium-translocating pyrophosphatase [Poriferisphaera sp. WC338]|uniref:sodium-translocating pyrophosphatase n=1 Tax=Poriferisphaera sp. WC338 TaxID=3425129 RepID=UPI003D81289F